MKEQLETINTLLQPYNTGSTGRPEIPPAIREKVKDGVSGLLDLLDDEAFQVVYYFTKRYAENTGALH